MQYCDEKPWDELEIRVYLGADGHFTLYEDGFDGQAYREGEFSTIDFSLHGRNLTIGARKGSYPGFLETRRFRVVIIGGKTPAGMSVLYTGKPLTIKL